MAYDVLMNTASALFFICYVPELYANWKNKNANFYNMPEKVVLVLASGFAFAYALLNNENALIANYGPLLALDVIAFSMRLYYVHNNKKAISDASPASDIILFQDSSPGTT
jgi:uncharacterized protein with PQ loop repeat